MKIFPVGFLFLVFSCFACQQLPGEEESIYKQVMEVHDAVMPKTKDIYKKSKALKGLLESTPDSLEQIKILNLVTELDQADKLMFDWMAEFKKKSDFDEGFDYKEYLSLEMTRIESVRDAMNYSLKNAETYLNAAANQ